MADKQDKQFDPTPQRIRKAREEGNLFRAQEMVSVLSLTTAIGLLALGLPSAFEQLKAITRRVFLASGTTTLDVETTLALVVEIGFKVLVLLLPFMLALTVTGIGANVLQSGWNFTTKPLTPKPSRISPLKGLQRIFSARGLFTTLKSFLKILIVGPVAYLNISGRLPELLMLHTLPVGDILGLASHWILVLVAQLLLVLLVLSGIDFAFEKWRYKEDLKMSKQELQDEQKEAEGDPRVKSKRRQFALKLARRTRLDHAVLKADVVVTNPTHYAVMLRYDPAEAPAPVVLAKGIRKRALRIKELARMHGVPMVEDRPLARALYHTVEESQEIPAELYPAVATILAEIYRKRRQAA
ncbi:flagellar biosynthesis protein FlhB [Rhodocaloribacter litoris]|uniref:flagellar biosynthesis protein FlhB n=1 Tax=Rhodocaloribacter litoris TaxID=2558931 RepID=UPI00141EC73E|nr:flagellar biosynthesis protein FlhB [Rhodocaloribacter litoris]QXD16067.1 flagellar biosynthesis protein FlhB [Rhodocaloribacter litoris]GIV59799.1 MAG: flagellar biosynthetic protein FlhB [Rhodothermaceae bacterium]